MPRPGCPSIFLLPLILTTLLGMTASAHALDDAVNTGRFSDTAIDGYDTVAYFLEGRPVEGSREFEVSWRGGTWRFANRENMLAFQADPLKYAPQYGGWCAYAMSDRGRTVRIDPEAWHIHEGRLYLNYSPKVQTVWLQDRQQNITEADGFYPVTTDVGQWEAQEKEAR